MSDIQRQQGEQALYFVGNMQQGWQGSYPYTDMPQQPPNNGYPQQEQYLTLSKQQELNMQDEKNRLDLAKKECEYSMQIQKDAEIEKIKLESHKEHEKIKLEYDTIRNMRSLDLSQNSEKEVICSVSITGQEGHMHSTKLLNVWNYRTCIYSSHFPDLQEVLEVSWNGDRNIYFHYGKGSIKPKDFMNKLANHGVTFSTFKIPRDKLANALLAFSIGIAERMELPYQQGWWKDRKRQWHFATKEELTLKEVLKNV